MPVLSRTSLTVSPGRRALAGLAVVCTVVAAMLTGVHPASAATVVTCAGTQNISYSPGLTNTPRSVTAQGTNNLGPCVVPNTDITAGTITFGSTGDYSCQGLLASTQEVNVVHWSDGSTSTLQVTRTATKVNGQLINTFTGSVTSGTFHGASVVWTITNLTLSLLACETQEGLTSLTGVDVFTLV
ncbi:hypothetical protein ACFV3R_11360 [Streptomyces sp. NPDC059740]|uniref:hypothetical protein n=1 Tax=Streptomyces sp. NPDC059740 TaxID=3346926 RepID=UPI00366455DE